MQNKVQHTLDINKVLLDFGLEENEIELYLRLVEKGRLSLSALSRETKIPKTTTFDNISKLQEKGLVYKVTEGDRIYLCAEKTNKLHDLLEEEKRLLESRLENNMLLYSQIPLIENSIKSLIAQAPEESTTLVRTFEGKQGFKAVCNRSLSIAEDEILFLSNHNYWRQVFTEEYDSINYVPRRVQKGIKMKSLVIKNEQGKKLQQEEQVVLRETRFLPEEFNLKTTFIMYKNEVSLMVSTKPYIAINIQSEVIYSAFRSIFYDLWDKAPKN